MDIALPGHGDADGLLRRDEAIDAVRGIGDGELHTLDPAAERIAARAVVRRDRGAPVFADLLAVDIKRHLPALAEPAACVGKFDADLVLAGRQEFPEPRRKKW